MKHRLIALAAFFAAVSAPPAWAQLPDLGATVGGVIDQTPLRDVEAVGEDLSDDAIRDLRQARAETGRLLRRQHPRLIDADPTGAPVVRNEIVAVAPSGDTLEAARSRGFTVVDRVESESLGLVLVVLRAPEGLSTRRALAQLRDLDPNGVYDFNHIYLGAEIESSPARRRQAQNRREGGSGRTRIGLIDSGVDTTHPAFSGTSVTQRGFGGEAVVGGHGTSVASLMVAAAPGTALYVADVYGGRPTGGGATAIVAALGWLAQLRVGVINISLVGPPNRALDAAVRAALSRGHLVVAAVGNDGPNAPPLYPAAYAGVVGVTGVDARNRALPEALRGEQVDFAAPAADLEAAAVGGGMRVVRGTSYAAPIVAGLLAQNLHASASNNGAQALRGLTAQARDLGAPGRDPVFGAGLVGERVRDALIARR